MRRLAPILLLALLVPALGQEAPPTDPTLVRIDSGPITGEVGEGVRIYRGLPYAAPPVGPLRWKPPQPVEAWEAPRACTEFGPSCLQPGGYSMGRQRVREQSEDCLTLNVWAPVARAGSKLPVMLWIHGGGSTIGSGSLPVYEGSALARRGVVVVTINYRLGPFGYFAHPLLSKESEEGVSGNYGVLDQIAALEWVRRNAAAFGGDPDRVTIFGESAGSVAVGVLMVVPRAKGLFHRAIGQSGSVGGIDRKLAAAWKGRAPLEERGVSISRSLGCEDDEDPLAALRAVSAEDLLGAARPQPATADPERKYGPVVDGVVLPGPPMELWRAGRQHPVPYLCGSNADDGNVFESNFPVRRPAGYRYVVRKVYGEHAEGVLALFPPDREETLALSVRRLLTVTSFVHGARAMARAMGEVPAKAYLYHFTRVGPAAERLGLGAGHGLEIPYVFGNAGRAMGWTETDRKVSDAMQRYWTAFARHGDPNVEGLPEWPPHEATGDRHLELGDRIRTGSGLYRAECDLLDRIRK
jgi:para-nitrobenzyl esterase